jgi:hypothetical protein
MIWFLVSISLFFQACVSVPSSLPDKATSIISLNYSKEEYLKCLSNNLEDSAQCSLEKEIYETNLSTHQSSFGIKKPKAQLPNNFNHILNWNSTWGKISTGFSGRTVIGRYPDYDGILKGTLEDDGSLLGYWFQNTSNYRCSYSLDDTYHWGTFRFTNFTSGFFTGIWSYCDGPSNSGGLWDGKIIRAIKEDK